MGLRICYVNIVNEELKQEIVQTRNCTYSIGRLSKLHRYINYGAAGEDVLKKYVLNGASYTMNGTFVMMYIEIILYDVNILLKFCKQTKIVSKL